MSNDGINKSSNILDDIESPSQRKDNLLDSLNKENKVADKLSSELFSDSKKTKDNLDTLFSKSSKAAESSSLSELFGDIKNTNETSILKAPETQMKFCKDCKHYLIHPYKSFCCLKKKDVEPTSDCNSFARRAKEQL